MITDTLTLNHKQVVKNYEKETEFLKILAMGRKSSDKIQQLLERNHNAKEDYTTLALDLSGLIMDHQSAKRTIEKLVAHKVRMEQALGRPVGIKSAALDFLENVDYILNKEAVEEAPTYDQLAKMAFYDPLTGLPNYRYFSIRLVEEIKRAQRYQHQLSLAMADIDCFKEFNDQHGHPAGNQAIQQIAQLMRSMIRDTDIIARYGGDEFAFIFPETTKQSARRLIERVRKAVEKNVFNLSRNLTASLTLSVGLSTYPRDADADWDLLNVADKSLYLSKKNGRNRLTQYIPYHYATFTYRPKHIHNVRHVSVVGNFNGWDPKADPLQRQDDGTFTTKTHLAPGKYQYKFLINGNRWVQDPNSIETMYDGFKGENSAITIKG